MTTMWMPTDMVNSRALTLNNFRLFQPTVAAANAFACLMANVATSIQAAVVTYDCIILKAPRTFSMVDCQNPDYEQLMEHLCPAQFVEELLIKHPAVKLLGR